MPLTQFRISVLLPVHNAAPFLDECLTSLAVQTFQDFEIVALDDGSTDGGRAMLRDRAQTDSRLRLFEHDHAGLVATLNRGLRECRAPLVARMDADDVSLPDRFAEQWKALDADPSLDVVSCLVEHFSTGPPVGRGFQIYEEWLNGLLTHEDIMRERFIESPLPHPSVMARRDVLLEAGGYRDDGLPEDYDLWLRLAEEGRRFGKVPRTLLRWREHPKRLTRRDSRYAVERFLACKARYLARGPLHARRLIVWGAGQTGRRLSKHLVRLGCPPAAFLDIDEKKWGRTLRGAPVHPTEDLRGLWELEDGSEPPVVVAAVSSRGARAKIRKRLNELGLVEAKDYWCAA